MAPPNFLLRCVSCKNTFEPSVRILRCTDCNDVLYIEHTASSSSHPALPLTDPGGLITLGEGETPVVELRTTAGVLGLRRLWAKLEFMQPTGSFKDRGSSVMISAAKEQGITGIVEDSSGNAGASIAAYAAVAGIEAHIFVPSSASLGKLEQIRIFGAKLHVVNGSRRDTEDAAVEFTNKNPDLIRLSHALSPFFIDGVKRAAYEVVKDPTLRDKLHIILPVGNGALALGLWRGFAEIGIGQDGPFPSIYCIQSNVTPPIASKIRGVDLRFSPKSSTIATGIAVESPPRLTQVEEAVILSGGSADVVDDGSILRWQKRIAEEEGIFCEPTSAAAFAGLEALVNRGVVPENANVLVPVTGTGLKEPTRIN